MYSSVPLSPGRSFLKRALVTADYQRVSSLCNMSLQRVKSTAKSTAVKNTTVPGTWIGKHASPRITGEGCLSILTFEIALCFKISANRNFWKWKTRHIATCSKQATTCWNCEKPVWRGAIYSRRDIGSASWWKGITTISISAEMSGTTLELQCLKQTWMTKTYLLTNVMQYR